MTDETKKLFDAPWKAVEDKDSDFAFMHHVDVCTNNGAGHVIACDCIGDDGNRLARLPELYDALMEAVRDACEDCVTEAELRTGMIFDTVEYGCIYPERDCCPKCRSWLELLRKVRDGE